MSGCFIGRIFGTWLLEKEYTVIEEMACEANQEAVFELIGGATAGHGSKEDFDVKLPGFNSSPKCCTKTSKEETLLMETVSEDNSYFGMPLQDSWATGSGILKKTVMTIMKPALKSSLILAEEPPSVINTGGNYMAYLL
jgi:hypothetical protein